MPPVFGHGHLRLYLLALLAEQPRHGYDLIQALGDRFGGTYVPSAGTIYPRLAKLEADGLVTKQSDGRKTVYAITDAGRVELEARRDELDGIQQDLGDSVRRLADEVRTSVQDAMRTLRADLAAAATEPRRERGDRAAQSGAASGTASGAASDAPSDRPGTADPAVPAQSLDALPRIDAALATFRADLRTEVRRAVPSGAVDDALARLLEGELDRVRAIVRERLAARPR